MKMKMRKSWISLLVIIALFVGSLPALANTAQVQWNSNSDDHYVTIAIVGAATVATVVLVRSIVVNSQAKKHYQAALSYANEGNWDLAVDEFLRCAEVKRNYKDVQMRIENARLQAEKMYVAKGDTAKGEEKFEEALVYYQRALYYRPTSTEARAKIDGLGQAMVEVFYRRGRTYESQNLWDEAYREYEKAYFSNIAYQDLTDRYLRAKAMVEGKIPARAILYFVNHSDQLGLEKPLIQALQNELEGVVSSKFYLMDYQRVQQVITEQAAGLGDTLNAALAMDLGRILGANEVMVGDIREISGKDGKVKVELSLQVLTVPGQQVVQTLEMSHTFGKEVGFADLAQAMPELAREIVRKMK